MTEEEKKTEPTPPEEIICASCRRLIAKDNTEALSTKDGRYFCGARCLPMMARRQA